MVSGLHCVKAVQVCGDSYSGAFEEDVGKWDSLTGVRISHTAFDFSGLGAQRLSGNKNQQ